MPDALITLSVIIPVYNGEETIAACLNSLYASTYQDFETIVVDDGSTDGTTTVVKGFPCKLMECAVNGGPGAGRNLAAAHAAGRILFFLDADILIEPHTLSRIVAAFDSHPEISVLFGSYHSDCVPTDFYSRYKNLLHHYTHQNSREDATTFWSGAGAIRREAFFAVGGFDPRWRFLEDVEMGLRLSQAGHRIRLDKRLFCYHCKRYTLFGLIRSDVIGRAIPWTRLILATRRVRNDLNTQTHNMLSVPLSFVLLAGLPAIVIWQGALVWAGLFALLVWLNRGFLGFVRRERGVGFASCATLMCWVGYLYSGVGLLLGILGHLRDKRRRPAIESERPS
jgi:glycosyltransferase involved in cell wall biosynthesis